MPDTFDNFVIVTDQDDRDNPSFNRDRLCLTWLSDHAIVGNYAKGGKAVLIKIDRQDAVALAEGLLRFANGS